MYTCGLEAEQHFPVAGFRALVADQHTEILFMCVRTRQASDGSDSFKSKSSEKWS